MGLFSRSSNSSSTSSTVNNYDQRQVTDASGGGIVGSNIADYSDRSTVNTAIDPGAFDLGGKVVAQVGASFDSLIAAGQSTVQANTDVLTRTLAGAIDLAKGAQSQTQSALESVAQAGSRASDAAASAYQGAADSASGTRQLSMVGLGAVALVAAFLLLPKLRG